MNAIDTITGPGRIQPLLLAALAVTLVGSCGTGSSQTAGIDRGGVVSGPVTGYGSVWVNGSRYATDNAEFLVNGKPANQADLAIGQVVLLTSVVSDTSLSAERVVYESNLQGPVDAVGVSGFMALGQQVNVNTSTLFSANIVPGDPTGLLPGDIVEVSGLVDRDGNILATYVEKGSAPYELQLSGRVSNATASGFEINGQAVSIDHAGYQGDGGDPFPAGQPQNGDLARVTVASGASAFGPAGEILAGIVAYRGARVATDDRDDGDIEGLISGFNDAGAGVYRFSLAGFAVVTDAQTEYEDGTAADLAENVRIEAEGHFDSSGTLIADAIEFRPGGDVQIEATADAAATSIVDAHGNTLWTVVVAGITVQTTPVTLIKGESSSFTPDDIRAGTYLRIGGSWDGSRVIATRLEQTGPEDEAKFDGPLTAASNPQFSLMGGTPLVTDAGTEFEVADNEGATAEQFFTAAGECLASQGGCTAEAVLKEGRVEKAELD